MERKDKEDSMYVIGPDGRYVRGNVIECASGHHVKGRRAYQPHIPPPHDRSCASDVYLHSIVEEKRKKIGEDLNEEEKQQLDSAKKNLEYSVYSIPKDDIMFRRIRLSSKAESDYIAEATRIVMNSSIPQEAKDVIISRVNSCIPIQFLDNFERDLRKHGIRKIDFASVIEVIIPINRLLANSYRLYGIREVPQLTQPIYKPRTPKTRGALPAVNLKDQIIDYLRNKPNRLAREIASFLDRSTHEVNSCIYRELKDELKQDKKYRWSIK